MSTQSGSNNELTPEGANVLKSIVEETEKLRALDLGSTPPAPVFEAEEP
jgi:hypothetical protein